MVDCEDCGCECKGCQHGAQTGDYSGCENAGLPACPCDHDWDTDQDGWVYCRRCGCSHPGNVPDVEDTPSLQDQRPDLFDARGSRRADY